jgi:hypothetical protein
MTAISATKRLHKNQRRQHSFGKASPPRSSSPLTPAFRAISHTVSPETPHTRPKPPLPPLNQATPATPMPFETSSSSASPTPPFPKKPSRCSSARPRTSACVLPGLRPPSRFGTTTRFPLRRRQPQRIRSREQPAENPSDLFSSYERPSPLRFSLSLHVLCCRILRNRVPVKTA